MSELTKDTATTKTFYDHIWDFNRYGFTLVEMILGYDLGLFEVLKDASKPLTSTEIADIADLKERYVKEWLSAISAAHVIKTQVVGDECRYSLSEEDYDIVKTSVAFGRGLCTSVGRLGFIKTCFKKQGPMGDPCAFGNDFDAFYCEYRTQMLKTSIPNDVFPKIESVTDLFNMLSNGCNVLDIGCGSGSLTMAFAKRYPKSFFTGLETSEEALTKARASMTEEKAVSNLSYKHATTGHLSDDTNGIFDVVMLYQVLHNLPDPLNMIEEIEGILKPGGKIILSETELHSNDTYKTKNMVAALQHTVSQFYCLPFSMSTEPHIGYGMGWGQEAMLKALGKYFTLDAHFPIVDFEGLYCLTKHVEI